MKNLEKFTLSKNTKENKWELKKDQTKEVLKKFDTKEKAVSGGSLTKVLGTNGGSVKIKKLDGTIQEERTFPRDRDPKKSRG